MIDKRRNLNRLAMLGLFGLATLALTTTAWQARADDKPSAATERELAKVEELSHVFRSAIQQVQPAVVTINATRTAPEAEVETEVPELPEGLPDYFREFFRRLPQIPREQENFGSGVIIRPDGHVLTNNHVVEGASRIAVLLPDGRQREAKIIGSDAKADLAVLKIEEENLPAAKLGDSDDVEVGDYCLALGAPFRLPQTVTQGIVSAKGRSQGIIDYENFIQTDAAINPGNSGGPLINIRGEVIGVSTAIQTRMGTFSGIGYAIPINDAHRVAELLIENGRIVRSYLGIEMRLLEPDLAATFGLDKPTGVLVNRVIPDSPAEDAGIRHGDIVLEFDGQAIESQPQVQNMVAYTPPGTKVKLGIWRDQRKITVPVVLAEQPEDFSTRRLSQRVEPREPAEEEQADGGFSWKEAGLTARTLTRRLARQFNWDRDRRGLVITAVNADGPAGRAGVREGDLLLEINGQQLETLEDLEEATEKASLRRGIRLYVETRYGPTYLLMRRDR